MSEKELNVKDYKDYIMSKLDVFIDTKSVKEMIFIKMEVLFLMNKINTKQIDLSGISYHLDLFIDIGIKKQDKNEDYGTLRMFMDKDFFEKL